MSKVSLKTAEEINILSQGGAKLARIMSEVIAYIRPGLTTIEIDQQAANLITQSGGESTFKGFYNYPAVSCLSVNDQVVHGIPNDRVLKEGDIIGVDLGLRWQGFCTDMAVTVPVGKVSQQAEKIIAVAEQAFAVALKEIRIGNHLGDIGEAVQSFVEKAGFGVVRDLTGHGIGRQPHEEPAVPNFGRRGEGLLIESGMVLAIEPMITEGGYKVRQLADGWTVATADGLLASHHEHTIAVTPDGPKVLTLNS